MVQAVCCCYIPLHNRIGVLRGEMLPDVRRIVADPLLIAADSVGPVGQGFIEAVIVPVIHIWDLVFPGTFSFTRLCRVCPEVREVHGLL